MFSLFLSYPNVLQLPDGEYAMKSQMKEHMSISSPQ